MCRRISANSFFTSGRLFSRTASASSYISSIVRWRKLSMVCLLSHGQSVLCVSMITNSLSNAVEAFVCGGGGTLPIRSLLFYLGTIFVHHYPNEVKLSQRQMHDSH